jgi:hypothetical protein
MTEEATFATRWLKFDAPTFGAGPTFDPKRINQHLEGRANGKRIMSDVDVKKLLNDPFATLVLRRGVFPTNLTEVLDALDEHNNVPEGLPETSSFLISEGGQIRFKPGIKKGGVRLLTVRSRGGSPELMISTLAAQGMSPRSPNGLMEVIAWDPINKTFHFYQRQNPPGAWFWCGQSDFAFDPDMRGEGPFDSHINGYPNMKELKAPWVHWDGPDLAIAATGFAPNDPLVSDPLFLHMDPGGAFTFETRVIRPLMNRWNEARFDKAIDGDGNIGSLVSVLRQVIGSTSFNLRTTHLQFSRLAQKDLDDLPATFFVDQDGIIDQFGVGLAVDQPDFRMSGARYRALIAKFDLRVRGNRNGIDIDQPGDVPFCFAVPERAFEDTLALHGLLTRNLLSRRLAACLLAVDFPNPLDSPARESLLGHVPANARLTQATTIDDVLVPLLLDAAAASSQGSPERRFKEHWDLGPDDWETELPKRIARYLQKVAQRLETDDGCDEIFRLAESRRRVIRGLPLLEFDLTLPVAIGIPVDAPSLEMSEDARVSPRA